MALLDKYRKQLGLPDTATADDVLAALEAQSAEGSGEGESQAEGQEQAQEGAPAEKEAKSKSAHSAGEPTASVTVSATAFSELQSTVGRLAAENKAFKDREDENRRNGIIKTALSEGRLHPTESKSWREALDSAEEVTVGLLSARQPVFPVSELGHDNAPHVIEASSALSDAQTAAENKLFGIGE